MNLKNRTSCLFKIVLFIIFSIFVAEIIVLPKIEHDMLKEAGRQELVTVQQLCGAVLEKNPDVEQDFILGLRQPTKSWQEKGEQILNQYGYDEEHLLADNTLYAAYMIAWRNWTGFFLITTFLLLATSLLYFYSIPNIYDQPRNTRKKCYDWTWIGGGISWWHGNLQHLLCFCHFQYTRDGEAKGSWCYQKTYSPLTIYRKPCTVFYRNPLWNLTWIPGNRILVQNGYSFRFYP